MSQAAETVEAEAVETGHVLRAAFLRAPYFVDGEEVRFTHGVQTGFSSAELALLRSVLDGGATLEDLAADLVDRGAATDAAHASEVLCGAFREPSNAIGLAEIPVAEEYDIIVVEQGYGGVYVHTVELVKRLRKRWRTLLISPVEPLFEPERMDDLLTLARVREKNPEATYLSWVSLVRTVIKRTRCKLLLIAHRSQSLYLFDLLGDRKTVIYCDGFYDGGFRRVQDFRLVDSPANRSFILSELYYLIANGNPNFMGIGSNPGINVRLLMAGGFSLSSAVENWCWGREQRENFAREFPHIQERIRFMPPFTDPELFHPEWVDREDVVLFTTTMHNIEKKGFPELVKAMGHVPRMRVKCVVRQPERLPKIPERIATRMEIGPITKDEMVKLYHRVWLNCRTSREESSPVSILEAMICEVPQIVSPTVGAQIPIIEDGATGFVVHPDDTLGLARALTTLLGDRRLRDRMGRECRLRAMEYSFDNRIGEFERLLT